MSQNRGFTLIELLMVVLMIGIITAIAISSYEEFRFRAYISKTQSGLNTLRTGQEAYYIDNNNYVDCVDQVIDGNEVGSPDMDFCYNILPGVTKLTNNFAPYGTLSFICSTSGDPSIQGYLCSGEVFNDYFADREEPRVQCQLSSFIDSSISAFNTDISCRWRSPPSLFGGGGGGGGPVTVDE
ncbi:MAG TPA: prepilin-type N-terminal cleavage/methylation domain-containing protein [Oligoflexia bacterium]|nr:prepilin-type N-terminal cleavage/methylation domain-containing protein [Oligoflexia bacterium]HMP27810.1 prepilin-type N-terminal cleavage/methylation domain-containing protein [Oligoflexia bacterium]